MIAQNELIEKVAEAICQADEQNGGPPWGYVKMQGKHALGSAYDRARAAIEAVMLAVGDPTPAMMSAMWSLTYANTPESFSECWRAMIQAALDEAAPRK